MRSASPRRKSIFEALEIDFPVWKFTFEALEIDFPLWKVIFEALKIEIRGGKVIFEALKPISLQGNRLFTAERLSPAREAAIIQKHSSRTRNFIFTYLFILILIIMAFLKIIEFLPVKKSNNSMNCNTITVTKLLIWHLSH